jgi:hypothetical protein
MAVISGLASAVSRVGQVNQSGADDALFLKQFGGEILTEFEMATVFKSRHYVRQITNGKTASFPLIGSVSPSYHVPGTYIDSEKINHAETLISVDGLLTAPLFLDKLDELMNHYDVRGPYATEMGRALAYQYDENVARVHVLAARASSVLTGRAGGSRITHANMASDAAQLEASLFLAAQTLDEKRVGPSDRFSYFRPAEYYLMVQREKLLNKDYSGSANISTGRIQTVAGIELIKTLSVPEVDDTANTDIHAKYRADYSKTVGIVSNRWAVGTVQLMDVSIESEWEVRRQGTFNVAKMAVGHDKLRPDCVVELALPAS